MSRVTVWDPSARTRLVGAIGLSVLASGSAVALMATSAWLLSRAAEHPPVLYLLVAVVSVRALGLARGVFRYLERLVSHDVALRMQAALRLRTYRSLAATTQLGRRRGDLLSRLIVDVEAVQDLVVRVIIPLASAGLVAAATLIMISVLSPSAGLALLASILLSGIGIPALAHRLSSRADRRLAPLRGELADQIGQLTHAAVDLVAYGADDAMLTRVQRTSDALRRAEARSAAIAGVASAGQWLATGLAVIGALLAGADGVAAGTVSPVEVAVLVLTPLALHEVLATAPAARQALTRARAALARVTSIPELAPPLPEPAEGQDPDRRAALRQAQGAVVVSDLTVGWPDGPAVATDLTFSVGSGERVAVIGPSGAGKTTVAATLLGLIPPVSGTATVQGRIGYLAQDAHIFDTSVAENVRIGNRSATDLEAATAVSRVGLDVDLDRLVGEHGRAVSGGEARRLALARLVVGSYDVLILDEPTEHLDRDTADALIADLWRAAPDQALLIITHDQQLMASCDRVVTLTSLSCA